MLSENCDRIHGRGPPNRRKQRERGTHGQNAHRGANGERIELGNAEQLRAEKAADEHDTDTSDDEARNHPHAALTKDE